MLLRDKFWLWGHPEGVYNGVWGNTGVSRMTPMEACLYLGVRNTFMVPVGQNVSTRQYNKSFKTLSAVGWECFGVDKYPEKIEQSIEESKEEIKTLDEKISQAKLKLKSLQNRDARQKETMRGNVDLSEKFSEMEDRINRMDAWNNLGAKEESAEEKFARMERDSEIEAELSKLKKEAGL